MKKYNIEEREIFSLLTSKQVAEISEIALIKDFEGGQIIYDQKRRQTTYLFCWKVKFPFESQVKKI